MVGYRFDFVRTHSSELLAFHWHPTGNSRVQTPHLHIRPLAPEDQALLRRAHLPTPELSFADIVRFAIVERGVEPRRQDWERLLAE